MSCPERGKAESQGIALQFIDRWCGHQTQFLDQRQDTILPRRRRGHWRQQVDRSWLLPGTRTSAKGLFRVIADHRKFYDVL